MKRFMVEKNLYRIEFKSENGGKKHIFIDIKADNPEDAEAAVRMIWKLHHKEYFKLIRIFKRNPSYGTTFEYFEEIKVKVRPHKVERR